MTERIIKCGTKPSEFDEFIDGVKSNDGVLQKQFACGYDFEEKEKGFASFHYMKQTMIKYIKDCDEENCKKKILCHYFKIFH